MSITAINTVVSHVMFMAELNGLLTLNPLAGIPGRAIQFDCDPQRCDKNKYSAIDRDFGQRVGAVMKDLWHRRRTKRGL
jgi:hypothetical protein